ncbi:hypothetical protein [Streptomyces sp. VRA16 Mangrove soil]|uniref:hypothetical protein n=1 Tax=Streptomyces sp. VRA16 Mangrove soil TaxID=2817434 RepID=UPI001A9E2B42|nr:hypothetical protein [Streptomyces sp. VRA16 Mangrove soil]MBO1333692.1 hypothetical protein [Streptomyces sp. VRA16 Mangrove soil]
MTGIERAPDGMCVWSAVVLDRVEQHIDTTANQLRRTGGDPRCRTTAKPYVYTREGEKLVLGFGPRRRDRVVELTRD